MTEEQCLTWNYAIKSAGVRHPFLCLVSFINASWDCVNQSRALSLTFTAPTNTSVLAHLPLAPQTNPCSPAAPPGSSHCICCFSLLLHFGKTEYLHTSNCFFFVPNLLLSAQRNIWLLSVVTAYCTYWGLDAKGSVISYSVGGRKLKPGKIFVWSWMSQRQLSQIPWPSVPEATQLGKRMKRTISLQIIHSGWAELSWASELQWLKKSHLSTRSD